MSALDHRTAAASPVGFRAGCSRDLEALRGLAAEAGVHCDELVLARLLRSDPAERLVLCAYAADDSLVGFGVIELDGTATMPSLILVSPEHGRPLALELAETLVAQARPAA